MRCLQVLAIAAAELLSSGDLAAQTGKAIEKVGSCPSGYYASGNYCVPNPNAKAAIEKSGSCPSRYYSSGAYCLATETATHAIPKQGQCPSGYYASGSYCISSR